MSFGEFLRQHKFVLAGSVALTAIGLASETQATQICVGVPSALGGAPEGIITLAADCTVTSAEQLVTPTNTDQIPAATGTQFLFSGILGANVTVEQGAGIVNVGNGANGSAILSFGGPSFASVTNDGFLASDSNLASTVNVLQNGPVIINNGTGMGSTRETSVIGMFSPTGGTAAVFAGGPFGGTVSGDVTINQGSASSAGSILSHSPTNSSGISVHRTSGNVAIHNFQGTISGPVGINVNTSGTVSIVNGIDANATGEISATVNDIPAIGIANFNPADPTLVPSSISITNNIGSTISAAGGQTGSAIFIAEIGPGATAGTITNHGTISTPGDLGFAFIRPIGVAGGGITLSNDGTITGEIVLNNTQDKVVMQGGVINGTILAPTGTGSAEISADSRLNGALASSTGAVIGDRSSVDLGLNFGELAFTADAALSVGHDPRNAVLNNNVFFSQLSADLRATQDGTGTVNYLFGTDINQSVGTASAGLKALNFLSGESLLRTSGASYHVAKSTIGSGAKLTLVPDIGGPVFNGGGFSKSGNRLAGDLTINGTLDLGSGTLLLSSGPGGSTGSVTVAAGGTLETTIVSNGPNDSRAGQTEATVSGSEGLGQIVNSGTVAIASGARIVPTIAAGVNVSDGARYNFITSGGEDGGPAASVGNGILVSSAGDVDFGLFRGDSILINGLASDVYLVANPGAAAGTVLENLAVNVSAGDIVDRLVEFASPTGQAEGQTLFAELLSIPTAAEIEVALTQLTPDVSGGASQGASAAQGGASTTVNARAEGVQNALLTGETGVAAGEDPLTAPIGIWGQAYGFNALQDARRSVQGFSAVGGGVAVGVDAKFVDSFVAGAALSYGQTRVDGRGSLSSNRTDVDSYQATLYGVYHGDPWYVQSQVGYAFQQFDARRSVNVGALSETPTADFDGDVFSVGASAGYPLNIGDVLFTPSVSLDYVQSRQDAYTETGAPTTALSVNENRDESLKAGLLARVSKSYELDGGGKISPEFRLGWFHEMKADAPNSVSQFAFGSSPFTTRGATPARDSINLGAGVKFLDVDGFSGEIHYDSEFKDRYLGNTLTIKARWQF